MSHSGPPPKGGSPNDLFGVPNWQSGPPPFGGVPNCHFGPPGDPIEGPEGPKMPKTPDFDEKVTKKCKKVKKTWFFQFFINFLHFSPKWRRLSGLGTRISIGPPQKCPGPQVLQKTVEILAHKARIWDFWELGQFWTPPKQGGGPIGPPPKALHRGFSPVYRRNLPVERPFGGSNWDPPPLGGSPNGNLDPPKRGGSRIGFWGSPNDHLDPPQRGGSKMINFRVPNWTLSLKGVGWNGSDDSLNWNLELLRQELNCQFNSALKIFDLGIEKSFNSTWCVFELIWNPIREMECLEKEKFLATC